MRTDIALDGAPRKNGELIFDEPWEARAFGIAITVAEQRDLDWEGFRGHLIAAVSEAPKRPYWESWVGALESWLAELGLAASPEIPEGPI